MTGTDATSTAKKHVSGAAYYKCYLLVPVSHEGELGCAACLELACRHATVHAVAAAVEQA